MKRNISKMGLEELVKLNPYDLTKLERDEFIERTEQLTARAQRLPHRLVRLSIDEDGMEVENPRWCLVFDSMGTPTTFCTGEVWGSGEGNAVGEEKLVLRGGITCRECLIKIKEIKAVRL